MVVYNKIVCPMSNKLFDINSSRGKNILKNYLKTIMGHYGGVGSCGSYSNYSTAEPQTGGKSGGSGVTVTAESQTGGGNCSNHGTGGTHSTNTTAPPQTGQPGQTGGGNCPNHGTGANDGGRSSLSSMALFGHPRRRCCTVVNRKQNEQRDSCA